jgi:hypothetical protein
MDPTTRHLAPHIVALLVRGIGVSLGAAYGARTRRGRTALANTRRSTFILGRFVLATLTEGSPSKSLSPSSGAGGPISESFLRRSPFWSGSRSLPRSSFRGSSSPGRTPERSTWVPSKDDRCLYAEQLGQQIRDVSPEPRTLTAGLSGDGGNILVLQGDIDAAEGDRLTQALQKNLSEAGFIRVEGKNGPKAWWSRM